jgi:magnesium transporter
MRLQPLHVDVRRLRLLLAGEDSAQAAEIASTLSPAELAEVLVQLRPVELVQLESHIGSERIADAVAQLDPSEAARLIVRFGRAGAADILEVMEPDDATDVVEELPDAEAEEVLSEMQPTEAREIRELMAYPSDTAAGRMTPEFVAISPALTVATAMRLIRSQAPDAETIYYVYVTDRLDRLVGVVSLRDLVIADPQRPISDVMRQQVIQVPVNADQELAARLLMEHDLLAIPVVDERGRIVGVVTADDVADVLEAEATEDTEKLGGSEPLGKPYLLASPWELVWKRVRWLVLLFVASAYTGSVLQAFEDELAEVVALALFIPMLIGTGGNTGTQITATVTRALATGDVRLSDAVRVFRKEMGAAVVLAVLMAVATYFRSWTLGVGPNIGAVVAFTAACIVVWAATVASLLPLVLKRLHLDPAVVSGPFITTIVDGTGLVIYFEIARWLLHLG